MHERSRLAGVLCAVIALGSPAAGETNDHLAIVGVALVDTEAGVVRSDRTIVVRDGRVVSVGEADAPVGAVVIDGEGLYALPGLIDSHVHYSFPEVAHPMMVAHGVAMVRDLGGDAGTVLALRDEMNAGGVRSPRMMAVGPIVDGNPPIWPFSEVCETPAQGRDAVRRLLERGVDQIKVYSGLQPDVYMAVCDEAGRVGLDVVGHVPLAVDVADALDAGQLTIEHLTGFDGVFAAAFDPDMRGSRNFILRAQAWEMVAEQPEAYLDEVAAPYGASDTVQCPTLVVMEGIANFAASADDPMLKYVPAFMREFWAGGDYKDWGDAMRAQIPGMRRFVGSLHRSGATIIAGTDLGNPNVVAGYSLHRELELLVECGLSPTEAIQSATVTPARVFGIDDLGVIKPGAEATILLLEENPLEDVSATRSIEQIVYRGEHLDRDALDRLLGEAERLASGQSVEVARNAAGDDAFSVRDLDMPGEAFFEGLLAMEFGGFPAGTESFRISREGDVFHIGAHIVPSPMAPQPPSVTTIVSDESGRLAGATYRALGENGWSAKYWREGDTLHASLDGTDQQQEMEIAPDTLLTGPAVVSDFFVLRHLALEVGESKTFTSMSFGYPTWQWMGVPNTITRLADEEVDGGAIRVFRQEMEIPGFGKFDITSRIDEQGVPLRTETKMPFGSMTAERGALPED